MVVSADFWRTVASARELYLELFWAEQKWRPLRIKLVVFETNIMKMFTALILIRFKIKLIIIDTIIIFFLIKSRQRE